MTQALAAPALRRPSVQDRKVLVVHCTAGWLKAVEARKHDFFRKLFRQATAAGVTTRVVEAGGHAARLMMEQNNVHLMVGGPPAYGPGRLHAQPSHVWGFWYLDEIGTGWHSSLRFARFCPDTVDGDKARYFFDGVAGHMLRENVSIRPQPPRADPPLDPAAATIFCQQVELQAERCHTLTTEQMIRVTATACARETVYLKPHPDQPGLVRKALMDAAARYPNVSITDASVHDLVAASRCVVTQNSSAGFEALMQRRCVITCGKSDFWHATLTPRTEDELRDALISGPDEMAAFPFDKYLYWFLDRNCLEPAKEDFGHRAWARIRDKGGF